MQGGRVFIRCTSLIALATTLPLHSTPAQEAKKVLQGDQTYVLHQRVEEVLLYCTVLDHTGHLVTNLEQPAFAVLEDGKPVPVTHFAHKDVPISLSLILDDSGSMKDKRAAVQDAALTLIKASNPEDETSVTNFADKPYLDQELTSDVAQLTTALKAGSSISGGTALFDTVISGSDHLAASAHRSKQVLVVVTDGNDNASEADLAAAIRRVQRADGPIIYAIGLLYDAPGDQARRAHKELLSLAEQTGGIAFFPPSVREVNSIAAEVARDIRNQYTIAFRPTPNAANDSYHTVRVSAGGAGQHGLSVRTRKGYVRVATQPPTQKQNAN